MKADLSAMGLNTPLAVLGGLSAHTFLTEYWQKQPLLVRGAMPELAGMFEPEDLIGLAQEPEVTARLLTQHGQHGQEWRVKKSPLKAVDFKRLPLQWTLLVQAVDHWSLELAELWKKLDFIPQWRRDDIMISYAPKGGSVGQHFDQYDVFLVQAYGARRWQLGKMCDENTPFVPNQPLRLLDDMGNIVFDEVLEVGDLLYVPPKLSHYGVAQNDCLTCSFGFRMPNASQLMERWVDDVLSCASTSLTTPIADQFDTFVVQGAGEVAQAELEALRQHMLSLLHDPISFYQSTLASLSEAKYPDHLPDPIDVDEDEWQAWCENPEFAMRLEPTARLLYRSVNADVLEFWCHGESVPTDDDPHAMAVLKQLSDGHWVDCETLQQLRFDLVQDWLARSMLMLNVEFDDQ